MFSRGGILIQQEKVGFNILVLGFLISQLEKSKIGLLSYTHNNANLAKKKKRKFSLVQSGGMGDLNQDY